VSISTAIKLVLVLFATVVLALLAFSALDTEQFRWQSGALAAFAAAFLPWEMLNGPRRSS
jgi:hypothetical protein